MVLGGMIAAGVAALAPVAASAGEPVIVPAPSYVVPESGLCPWEKLVCLLPSRNAIVDWPTADLTTVWPAPKQYVLPAPGLYALWAGDWRYSYPLFWHDVGSGTPNAVSGPWEFPNAGKYSFECATCSGVIRTKLQGTMYVIGPRPIVAYRLVSANNSGTNPTYSIDASESFVTDYEARTIVRYQFDFEDDGTFDQDTPDDPTAQHEFTAGPHTVRVRVTDSVGRSADWPLFFEVPKVTAPNPDYTPLPDNGASPLNPTGVRFSSAKVRLSSPKRVRVAVLRSRGLKVKVSGLTKGDVVRARLLQGKKSVIASGRGTSASNIKTVRLRVGKAGKRILKAMSRPKRLVIDVAVEGTDGFTVTKRLGIRIS